MKKVQKSSTEMKKCHIHFPVKINTKNFESLLKEKYHISKKNDEIIFDFSNVNWCSIFELSLISLWIIELSEKYKKEIVFIKPQNNDVKHFLIQYEFNKFLASHNIENSLDDTIVLTGVYELISIPYFPLKFYTEKGFLNFFTFLSDEDNYDVIFNDLKTSAIGNSQFLRNIIIKEIGDNMYKHANGLFSNIIMSKYGKGITDKEILYKRTEAATANSIGNEKQFFKDLAGRDYFTIVISDKGPGIYKKLFEFGWKMDDTVNKNHSPSVEEIIKYAFQEYSSSRTKEERYGPLSDLFDNKLYEHFAPQLPGPTGLYQVLNIVKQNHGFIYVRSGASIVSYNFYGNTREGSITSFNRIKRIGKLTHFGGTQIKIHFPYDITYAQQLERYNRKYFPIQKKFKFPESDIIKNYRYVSITEYDVNNFVEPLIQKENIIRFQEHIKKHKSLNRNSQSGIILDLYNQENISSKVIYFFIGTLMDSQESNYSHVIINLSPILVPTLKTAFSNQENINTHSKPIILFDTNFHRHIIGVSNEEELLFNNLFHKEKFEEKKDIEFISKNDHLFYFDDSVGLKHNRSIIFQIAMLGIQNILQSQTLKTEYSIYNPSVKVLMPTGYYCEGYFQIFYLVENKLLRNLIKQWISYFIVRYKPNIIVSVSQNCIKIVDELYVDFNIRDKPIQALHFKIKSPLSLDKTVLFELGNEIKENNKVVVFTDVVATQKSISQILKRTIHASEIIMIAIVNATPGSEKSILINEKQILLKQFVRKSLKFYDKKPENWNNEVITNVDVTTNNLILKKHSSKGGIWNDYRKENFLNEYIINNQNFLIGHYEHDKTHLPVLFDIPNVCNQNSDVIAQVISNHFKSIYDFSKTGSELNNKILFLSDKSELNKVAVLISKSIYFTVEQINNKEITEINDYEGNEYLNSTLIFIDDAVDTGESVFKVIDYCYRKNAKNLFIYIFIKRGSDYYIRRISELEKYGNMRLFFNFLSEINIPTYNINQCPICKRKTEIDILIGKIEGQDELSQLTVFIKDYSSKLKARKFVDFKKTKYFIWNKIIQYSNEDFELRFILENAKHDSESREEIIHWFYTIDKNISKIKKLISLVARENLYFLFDSKYGTDEKRFIFKQNVILSCKKLAVKLSFLSENEYDGVLSVLRYLNEETFIDKLYSYINKTINNERFLLTLLMHIFLSKQSNILIQSISHSLNKVISEQNKKGSNINLSLLKQFLVWWEQNKIKKQDRILTVYFNLRREINHEITKHITSIKGYLNSPKKEQVSQINLYFSFLRDAIEKNIYRDLRELIEFDFCNKDIITRSEKLINKLADTFDYYMNAKIYFEQENDENIFLDSVSLILKQIDDIIYNKAQTSLSETLNMCITNLSDLWQHILKIRQAELNTAGITYNKLTVETPIVVFGDEPGIFSIFDNIIENIIIHSNATKLHCEIKIDKVKNEVNVFVVDNGVLPVGCKEGYGINNIIRNTTRYSNNPYELRKVSKKDIKFYNKFNTLNYVNFNQIVQI